MLSKQEIFEKAVNHLRTQGRPAKDPNTTDCLYVTPDGLRCAVGCLLPEELTYEDRIHALPIEAVRSRFGLTHLEVDFLQDLQAVHDGCPCRTDGTFYWTDLNQESHWFALKYGLDWLELLLWQVDLVKDEGEPND